MANRLITMIKESGCSKTRARAQTTSQFPRKWLKIQRVERKNKCTSWERKQQADVQWRLPRSCRLVKEHASFLSWCESRGTLGGSTSRLVFSQRHAHINTDQSASRLPVNNQLEQRIRIMWPGGKAAVMHGKIRLVRRPIQVKSDKQWPIEMADLGHVVERDYVRKSTEMKRRNAWWYPGQVTRCPFTWLLTFTSITCFMATGKGNESTFQIFRRNPGIASNGVFKSLTVKP